MQKSQDKKFNQFLRGLGQQEGLFAGVIPMYGGTLLDMNALHEIYQSMNSKQKVFFIAGAAHIYGTIHMLNTLGYTLIYETGADLSRVSPVTNPLYDIDSIMAMSYTEYQKSTADISSQTARTIIPLFQKRVLFNPQFFDLISSDNPEAGWQRGHGAIQ